MIAGHPQLIGSGHWCRISDVFLVTGSIVEYFNLAHDEYLARSFLCVTISVN